MLRNELSFKRVLYRFLHGVEEALLVRSMDVVDVRRIDESKSVLLGVPLGSIVGRGRGEGEDGVDAVVEWWKSEEGRG